MRDKMYVDDIARAYYYDAEGDVQHWITSYKVLLLPRVPLCTDGIFTFLLLCLCAQERYVSRHLKALLTNGIGPTLKKKRLQELLASVDEGPPALSV